jgi:hypothetical protein
MVAEEVLDYADPAGRPRSLSELATAVLGVGCLAGSIQRGPTADREAPGRSGLLGQPFPNPRRREMMAENKGAAGRGDTMKKQIIIDSNGFLSVPNNFRLTFLMEQTTLDFIEDTAVRIAKADRGRILMSTLVGEQMNPKQPIHIIISVDGNERGEKSVALIATQTPVGLTDPVTVQVFAHAERESGH